MLRGFNSRMRGVESRARPLISMGLKAVEEEATSVVSESSHSAVARVRVELCANVDSRTPVSDKGWIRLGTSTTA